MSVSSFALSTVFGPKSSPSPAQSMVGMDDDQERFLLDVKSDVMASWIYQQQLEKLWASGQSTEGVVLKKSRGNYTCCPITLENEAGSLFHQVMQMNVRRNTAAYVPLSDGLRLQVLPSITHLPKCQKHHFGAFIQDQLNLIVWEDQPKQLLGRAEHIERSLIEMIWNNSADDNCKSQRNDAEMPGKDSHDSINRHIGHSSLGERGRPTFIMNAIIVGLTLSLLVAAMGLGWRSLAQAISIDGTYLRLVLLAVTPCQIFVSLFFIQIVVVNLAQIVGPIGQLKLNSKFYSGKPPAKLDRIHCHLPHVTIQMPVYKEGLAAVIQPTVTSLKAAISTYELQGGTANIFVNDDGMQLASEREAQARREFYDENNIGWVARPPHNPTPRDGGLAFTRKGKFKKASNMNYALMLSNKVEDKLILTERHSSWNQEDETRIYARCLAEVLYEEEGKAWAQGNIRIGDYILLVDSDTRVPADCLLDAVSEMEQCRDVGILQHASGVMRVTDSFFENGVTFFTNLIYTAIRYTVANGDVAPFVGHNAVLRWSALQQVSYRDEDEYDKFWSESHVSEDFDMALRLQVAGYIIRLGSYTDEDFKEGVSLTVYDELSRWEKYAFGCNELLFNPFRLWITRGPFTPLFVEFITSNIRFTSKITILAYIGTYYALGAAWILTLGNYFLTGWYNGYLDHYYLDSFKVYFSLIIVFSVLGNISLAILRYRLSERSLFASLYENFKWLLLLTIFLGGISLHISQALLGHFFEIDMTWGATAKEIENTSFFEEMPKLLRRFKGTFIFCFACSALMIAGALAFPVFWRITDFVAIFPLGTIVVCHFLLPVALNPALMMFTW